MFPKPECFQLNRLQGIWQIHLEGLKCIITVIAKVFLHDTPEELNIIEFTVKFQEEDVAGVPLVRMVARPARALAAAFCLSFLPI